MACACSAASPSDAKYSVACVWKRCCRNATAEKKELEALETIAGKVGRLTVHNGTGGLPNDLVKLREN